ncbi:hypothetical protein [Ramlibacter sp. 2FC]|uniref:hypothetical protein n=1 Tax=Ramlibacter sp. 2FC TaxID=2502188 RepID=UPI0010F9C867|nr:hypothetical protein [Ramlibacter sp. 2FC]
MRLLLLALPLWLAACSPTFDWREVRFDPATPLALLPCKPDRGTREVVMGQAPVTLQMAGCETGGATFAVMLARLDDAKVAGAALAGWKQATLANMHAGAVAEAPFQPPGSLPLRESLRVTARGQRPDGRAVQAQAVWLAQASGSGVQLVHAVVYADTLSSELADTFFSGLRLP